MALLDVPWILGSWVVYFAVNNALVSGVLSYAQSFRSGLTEDLGYYVTTTFSVLALSPRTNAEGSPGRT